MSNIDDRIANLSPAKRELLFRRLSKSAVVHTEQGLVTGPVPLTPIQQWFFAQAFVEPHHWNQAFLLEVRQVLDAARLERAVEQVLQYHDAFRLRFTRDESGWRQVSMGAEPVMRCSAVDLSALSLTEQEAALSAAATDLQTNLNLVDGPLAHMALVNLGHGKTARLLVVIHHLIVDTVSWRILLEDLHTVYRQLSCGEAPALPAKTTSYQQWAWRLTEYAQSAEIRRELPYWLMLSGIDGATVPMDYPRGTNSERSARTVTVMLDVLETQALLREVPAAYHTQINEALLTALAQACAPWVGASSLLVAMEGHGREDLFEGVDWSRTVGWFTSVFPVLLQLPSDEEPGAALQAIKEQLHALPHHGIGYGVLRYLGNAVVAARLESLPPAQVSFNYLGRFDQMVAESSLFSLASESSGLTRSPLGRRPYLLDIEALVSGGTLQVHWTYSENVHKNSTIEAIAYRFVAALRALIVHCQRQ